MWFKEKVELSSMSIVKMGLNLANNEIKFKIEYAHSQLAIQSNKEIWASMFSILFYSVRYNEVLTMGF